MQDGFVICYRHALYDLLELAMYCTRTLFARINMRLCNYYVLVCMVGIWLVVPWPRFLEKASFRFGVAWLWLCVINTGSHMNGL